MYDRERALAVAGTETLEERAAQKERELVEWLAAQRRVVIGYSGGVDSAYLACVAVEVLGAARVLAVTGRSPSYPAEQWEAARAVAARFGIPVQEIETQELHDPNYVANPSNRCYFCKSELWSRVLPLATAFGGATVIDGTNADDLRDHRPGASAGTERGVRSPLAEVGMMKSDIRARSRARDIPTWTQPSSPCLASRLPYGTSVTSERLLQVERAERALRAIGVATALRVRHHGDLALVEIGSDELGRWLAPAAGQRLRDAILATGAFSRVAIDLRGYRSGSLNVLAGVSAA